MFNQEQIAKALDSLVGNVEWVYSHRNLQDGLDIIFRVGSELRGLTFSYQEWGRVWDAPQRLPTSHELTVESLKHRQCLRLAAYFEAGGNGRLSLLTDEERKEWQAISEQRQREKEKRETQRKAEEEAAERRQYRALKDKYG